MVQAVCMASISAAEGPLRNDGRAFGVCGSCRYFLAHAQTASAAPHRCTLLDEPLSEADSRQICAEQDPAAA